MKQALNCKTLILVITAVRAYLGLERIFFILFYCSGAPHYKKNENSQGHRDKADNSLTGAPAIFF